MPVRRHALALPLLLLTACADDKGTDDPAQGSDSGSDTAAAPSYADAFTAVSLDASASAALALAVVACQGLDNRALGGSVYVVADSTDQGWLDALGLSPAETLSAEDYLSDCLSRVGACVTYNYESQHAVLPAVLTAAAALGAVPLDTGLGLTCTDVALDATASLAGLDTPLDATRAVFEAYGEMTTGLAMLNPGYDTSEGDASNPPLTRDMPSDTVDLVFARRLFALFLVNGCVSGNAERDLLDEIVNAGRWDTPLGVYGYNDSWLVGGYLYEAQTRCLDSRNMGAIPSKTGNLSFFSTRRPPITEPGELSPNDAVDIVYDPATTYVAFVIGDGDNIDYILSKRNTWLNQRLEACASSPDTCLPLTWSISPHLPRLAPDVLEWYYTMAAQTGQDGFSLPPSGHLYAYPSSLNEADQERFVAATEADAQILGVHTTVHWEWYDSWETALDDVLPGYAALGQIQGIIPVNVPYLVEPFPDWPDEQSYEVLDDAVVVFRSREWRGVSGDDAYTPTPEQMAEDLAALPAGTVAAIYVTSDGGLDLSNSLLPLMGMLPEGVELVSAEAAARLALEANAR